MSSDDPIDDSDEDDEDYYQTSAQKRKAKNLENSLKKKQNKKALKDLEELQLFKAKHRFTFLEHVFVKMQLEGWRPETQHLESTLKTWFGLVAYFREDLRFIGSYHYIPFWGAIGDSQQLERLNTYIDFLGINPFIESDVKKFFRFTQDYIKLVFLIYFASNHYAGRYNGVAKGDIDDFFFTRFFERGIDNAMAQIARLNLPARYIPVRDKPVDLRRFYTFGRQLIDFYIERHPNNFWSNSPSQLFPWFKGDNYWTKGKHTACVTTSALKQVQFALFITNRHLKVDQSTLGFINDKIVHSILF